MLPCVNVALQRKTKGVYGGAGWCGTVFFSWGVFGIPALFEGCLYPWEALGRLPAYLKSLGLGKIESEIVPGVYLSHPELISIGSGTVIEPGAYLQGPCVIGKNCTIRHGAYIRGDVLMGEGCVIGHGSEVKNSILLNRSCAAHFNYVSDSILGNGTNLGAGVKCANLRLDHQPVHVCIADERINTGLTKLGAIVGDRAQVGAIA